MTTLLREVIGDVLRQARLSQGRTLREVSDDARVSLGYLSEVERGRKEASSELLSAICGALEVPLSRVLTDAGETMERRERVAARDQRSARKTLDQSGHHRVALRQRRGRVLPIIGNHGDKRGRIVVLSRCIFD